MKNKQEKRGILLAAVFFRWYNKEDYGRLSLFGQADMDSCGGRGAKDMPETVLRGYMPEDARDFWGERLALLRGAQKDVAYLLNRGYDVEHAVRFVGDHFQLSARQRMALMRATSRENDRRARRQKEICTAAGDKVLRIDGFNVIILLEAALSGSTVLRCMDGVYRDLCGLHGTYRIIDKTPVALGLLASEIQKTGACKAEFYLDAPISNSGRLRALILSSFAKQPFQTEVFLVNHADALLWDRENVATGDAIILDRCVSWLNLPRHILERELPGFEPVELAGEPDKTQNLEGAAGAQKAVGS